MSLWSRLTSNDERVLWHNHDIPPSVRLHFTDLDSGAIPGPNAGDICVYERMFLARLQIAFPNNGEGTALPFWFGTFSNYA